MLTLIIFSTVLSNPLQAQLSTGSPWPMFRQNLRHTGQSNNNVQGPKNNPVLKWSFTAAGSIVSSPAVAPDGTVYFGEDKPWGGW